MRSRCRYVLLALGVDPPTPRGGREDLCLKVQWTNEGAIGSNMILTYRRAGDLSRQRMDAPQKEIYNKIHELMSEYFRMTPGITAKIKVESWPWLPCGVEDEMSAADIDEMIDNAIPFESDDTDDEW